MRRALIIAFLFLLLLLLGGAGVSYWLLQRAVPAYAGSEALPGLNDSVEVLFDPYGIPHIYAQTEVDAYRALGYLHARERLFQMEMIRRVSMGRLSEILGPELVKTDAFFLSLGLHQQAEASARAFLGERQRPFQRAAYAYLDGVNAFIEQGPRPPEFVLLGIEAEPFTPAHLYDVAGFMAFGFAEGMTEDPVLQNLLDRHGPAYLADLVWDAQPGTEMIPVFQPADSIAAPSAGLGSEIAAIRARLPLPLLQGSNSWVLGPSRSQSGAVLFANDPHIGYSQPAVWFEAHLHTPNWEWYGYHLAGFPFAPIGHNRGYAVGLTMLENDDVYFYQEEAHPDHPDQLRFGEQWEPVRVREETIAVKGQPDTVIRVRRSRHGPILNDVFERLDSTRQQPVALWWEYLQQPAPLLEVAYDLAHIQSFEEAAPIVARLNAPGLNIMYGDSADNIAWWGAARLPIFPAHVNPKLFLDGATGKDELLGYRNFAENPQSLNPPIGYVYSANNQPASFDSTLLPGYFAPEDRARRIVSHMGQKERFSAEDMKLMMLDDVQSVAPDLVQDLLAGLNEDFLAQHPRAMAAQRELQRWQGGHALGETAPVIYYAWLYHLLEMALADELGEADFKAILPNFLLKRSYPVLLRRAASLWWDDVSTPGVTETRAEILGEAFVLALEEIEAELGPEMTDWEWGMVHQAVHPHVMGQQPPFDRLFNVGPIPVAGGNEVLNNIGFKLQPGAMNRSSYGPSRRTVIDFAAAAYSWSVLPTGNSGHWLSPHYADQAGLYHAGKFRPVWLERAAVEKVRRRLWLAGE